MIDTFFSNARLILQWFVDNVISHISGSLIGAVLGTFFVLIIFVAFIRSYIYPN